MPSTTRQELDKVFEDLFSSNNLQARTLFAYIQKVLFQYGLGKTYEPKDILIEVYSRSVRLTDSGETIRIPIAWIKRTATNVIREFRREAEKVEYYNLDREPSWNDDPLVTFMFWYDLKAMKQAFQRLDPDEQQILNLRVIQRLSWKDVSRYLTDIGESEQHEGTLRQRGFRALRKLRKIYEKERDSIQINLDEVDLCPDLN